ncbi:MAG: hypothetical protein KAW51_01505 [Candidatus Lokiarchaeota archaeon]|nr:hypothetical protein [Candidatus Lokiarchaeota archaeon]
MNRFRFSRGILLITFGWLIFFSIIGIGINLFFMQTQSKESQNFLIPSSCTIFTVNISNTVYFGNNEDYFLEGTYMWLVPSQEITTPSGNIIAYGYVSFGYKYNNDPLDGIVQGGMNDQGLCVDANGLPSLPLNPHRERESPWIYLITQTLFECANVSEVIDWFLTHYLGTYGTGQVHYADASGDAVVVSVGTDGEFNFTRNLSSHYLVSTNFNLANPSNRLGSYPCGRYTTATTMLENITAEMDLTVDACRDILDAVHAEGYYATKYSNIFDPINLEIHLYHNGNFDKRVSLDLVEELGKVHPGGKNVLEESGVYYYKEVSIASLFETPESPSIPGYPPVVLISTVALWSLILIFLERKRN